MCPPAATIGDPADLLDVHVDQLAGAFTLVADCGGLRGPDHQTGQRVALTQPRQAMAAQDPRHRPGWDAELRAEPVLTLAMLDPRVDHPLLDLGARTSRRRVRPRAAVLEACVAFGVVSGDPTMDALA